MAKGASRSVAEGLECREDVGEYRRVVDCGVASVGQAERRVLEIQTKLHRWANDDPHRRFDDIFNLVTDPGFLLMAWERVAGNKGARSAGVDGMTAAFVEERIGVECFLTGNAMCLPRSCVSTTPITARWRATAPMPRR
jgi:hypothetical protein